MPAENVVNEPVKRRWRTPDRPTRRPGAGGARARHRQSGRHRRAGARSSGEPPAGLRHRTPTAPWLPGRSSQALCRRGCIASALWPDRESPRCAATPAAAPCDHASCVRALGSTATRARLVSAACAIASASLNITIERSGRSIAMATDQITQPLASDCRSISNCQPLRCCKQQRIDPEACDAICSGTKALGTSSVGALFSKPRAWVEIISTGSTGPKRSVEGASRRSSSRCSFAG